MYCKNCGAKLTENTAFCANCGMPVNRHSEREEKTRAKKNTGKNFGIAAMFTLVGSFCSGGDRDVLLFYIAATLILSIISYVESSKAKQKCTLAYIGLIFSVLGIAAFLILDESL